MFIELADHSLLKRVSRWPERTLGRLWFSSPVSVVQQPRGCELVEMHLRNTAWCAMPWATHPTYPELGPFPGSRSSKGIPACWAQGSCCLPPSATLAVDPRPSCPPTPQAHTHRIPQAWAINSCFVLCLQSSSCCYRTSWRYFSVMTFWLIWIWDYPHGDFWPGPRGFQPGFTNIVGKRSSSQRCAWIIPPGVITGLKKLPAH